MRQRTVELYDALFLSPHLDDAILSCGGYIFELSAAGRSVLIVNIMAGSPPPGPLSAFAHRQHQRWQLPENAIVARRAEDASASTRVGADSVCWDVLDCIYRRHPEDDSPLYASEEALFGPVHPAEASLVETLSQRLATLPESQQVYAPLGVGGHVDHQVVRQAAEACPALKSLRFYEDYPYVQRDRTALAAALGDEQLWLSELAQISEAALQAKIDAIACYKSQLANLFGDAAAMASLVRRQVTEAGGERFWRRAPLPTR